MKKRIYTIFNIMCTYINTNFHKHIYKDAKQNANIESTSHMNMQNNKNKTKKMKTKIKEIK
jgi:hypothetical protein